MAIEGKNTAKGFRLENGTLATANIKVDLQDVDVVAGIGKTVTFQAANFMVDRYWQEHKQKIEDARTAGLTAEVDALKKQTLAVTFGKEVLFQILSQKGCEGVRLYFCKTFDMPPVDGLAIDPQTERTSILLVGVADDHKDLGIPSNKDHLMDYTPQEFSQIGEVEEFDGSGFLTIQTFGPMSEVGETATAQNFPFFNS